MQCCVLLPSFWSISPQGWGSAPMAMVFMTPSKSKTPLRRDCQILHGGSSNSSDCPGARPTF
eukprot:3887630-Pyramimonas_sp.AAC.1